MTGTRYEQGVLQSYQYAYTNANQVDRIRLNGLDLETKRYDARGQVVEDNHYDN